MPPQKPEQGIKMKDLLSISALFIVVLFGACANAEQAAVSNNGNNKNSNINAQKPKPTPAIPHADVERISLTDAKADFDAGSAVFVDTHSPRSFENERIAGAVNVPVADYEAHLDKLPKGKKIIAYCS